MITGLSLWPTSSCLISELAEELLARPPSEWRRLTIILPTRRLQNWLLALLSERVPAFVPPQFFNFDEFVARLARNLPLNSESSQWSDLLAKGPLDPLSEELLLAGLLRSHRFQHLRPGCEHEVRQLFAEMRDAVLPSVGEGSAYARLRALVAADYVHCEESLVGLAARIEELESLHQYYDEACRVANVVSAASLRATVSLAVAIYYEQEALEGRPSIINAPYDHTQGVTSVYLVGFTSLAGCHERFLKCLAKAPNVAIWLSETPPLKTEKNPLLLLRAMLAAEPQARQPISRLSQLSAKAGSATVRLHKAPTPLGETAAALSLIRAAIDQGTPPSQIALLITNDAAYGPILRCLLLDSGIPVNMAVATPLAQSTLGAWLRSLFDLLGGREEAAAVLDFLTQTQTLDWLLRQQNNVPIEAPSQRTKNQNRSALKTSLVHDLCASGIDHGLGFMATSSLMPEATRLSCSQVRAVLAPLIDSRWGTLSDWRDHLLKLLSTFADLEASETANADDDLTTDIRDSIERSATTAARQFLDALAVAARQTSEQGGHASDHVSHTHGRGFTLGEFIALIKDKMLAQEIRDVGDQLYGVQILSVEEARYVPFRYVIILGATEGQFPQALPKDRLLDNALKSKIGLPGWQLREAIEDTTFHLLLERLPALDIFFPEKVGQAQSVRSRFIERLLLVRGLEIMSHDDDEPTLRFLRSENAPWEKDQDLKRHGARDWMKHRESPVGMISGTLRQEIKAPLSASALEKLLTCPYRFLLDRLGGKELTLPRSDDVMAEGDWLHQILEAFFTGETNMNFGHGTRRVAPPLQMDLPWTEFESYVTKRLMNLTDHLAPAHVKDSAVYLQLQYKSWPAFAAHLQRLYSEESWFRAASGMREQSLSGPNGDPLRLDLPDLPEPLMVRGYIDSVDETTGLRVLTDYKRRGVPSAADSKRGLAPQLWLYAYALAAKKVQEDPDWAATTSPEDSGRFALARPMVLGYWSILKGEWSALGATTTGLETAKERGLVPERAKALNDLEPAVMDLWRWRLKALLETDEALAPDPTSCGFCRYNGICRKDDPQLAPEDKPLKIYLEKSRAAMRVIAGAKAERKVRAKATDANDLASTRGPAKTKSPRRGEKVHEVILPEEEQS